MDKLNDDIKRRTQDTIAAARDTIAAARDAIAAAQQWEAEMQHSTLAAGLYSVLTSHIGMV